MTKFSKNSCYYWLFFLFTNNYYYLNAQTKNNENVFQGWFSYITNTRINQKYSLWNDVHYNPTAFLVLRTGITRQINENVSFTLGYAWTKTATSFSDNLIRKEHRPWGQLVANLPIPNSRIQLNYRLRYDMRFRQKIENNALIEDWILVHRVRFLTGFRIPLSPSTQKNTLFLNIFDEVLLNFGETIVRNNLDQNRIGILLGKTYNNITIQSGYVHRYVPSSSINTFTNVHSWVIWVAHNFRKK